MYGMKHMRHCVVAASAQEWVPANRSGAAGFLSVLFQLLHVMSILTSMHPVDLSAHSCY